MPRHCLNIAVLLALGPQRGDPLDGRLKRMGATAALLMEALAGFEHKFEYSLAAHSGATAELPLVEPGRPPATGAERAAVVRELRMERRMTGRMKP